MALIWVRRKCQMGLVSFLAIAGAIASFGDCAKAQNITLDGSLGPAQTLTGPNYQIPQGVGQTVENNLFHSFGQFNLNIGETATFQSAPDIRNILSRITGGSASSIDGILRTASGNVNLFLINPNGIIFGENASLDVSGSFAATTANAIGFGDRGNFSASPRPNENLSLLTVNPSAFLFNQIGAGSITVNSGRVEVLDSAGRRFYQYEGGLRVPNGRSLLLVGNNVSLNGAVLLAPGGQVELGGLADSGVVALSGDGNNLRLSFPDNVTRADVAIADETAVDIVASGGGNIAINARNFEILGGSVLLAGIGGGLRTVDSQAGNIEINATGAVTVAGGVISNSVQRGAAGNSGDLNITAGSLSVRDGAQLQAISFGQGNAGSVTIDARETVSFDGETSDGLPSGPISLVARGAEGNAGDIKITTGSLSVTNGAKLQAAIGGQGDVGSITIDARETVSFDGAGSGAFSEVEATGIGNVGNINITTESLSMTDGAQLKAFTAGQGDAGSVTIDARESVSFDGFDGVGSGVLSTVETTGKGNSGRINITTGSLSVTDTAGVAAIIGGQGNVGSMTIQARNSVSFDRGASVLSAVNQGGVGEAGGINLTTGSLSLSNSAQLSAVILSDGQGNAGNLQINATDSVSVSSGSQLQASTLGQGNAGNVTIQSGGLVSFDGVGAAGLPSGAGSFVGAEAVGNGGNISIQSESLSLTNGAFIIADTLGQGNAASVSVQVNDSVSLANSNISARANSTVGRGGNITIKAESLSLTGRRVGPIGNGLPGGLSSATSGTGDAGDLTIETGQVLVQDGAAISTDTASAGNAGELRITTGQLKVQNGSLVSASTVGEGRGGTLNVTASESVEVKGNGLLGTATFGAGDAGNLKITTGQLLVRDWGEVVVGSGGTGDAGNLEVTARTIELDNRALILASAFTIGGGNITLKAQDLVLLRNGSLISASAGLASVAGNSDAVKIERDNQGNIVAVTIPSQIGDIRLQGQNLLLFSSFISNITGAAGAGGNGGNITIDAPFIVAVPGEDSDIYANAFEGNGGNINITARGIYGLEYRPRLTPLSDITASSEFGVDGTIQINTPGVDPTQALTKLPTEVADASGQIQNTCGAGGTAREENKFIITGRGGLPPSPNEPLQSESVITNWVTLDPQAENSGEDATSAKRDRIALSTSAAPAKPALVEAQGWVFGSNGEVILTANAPTVTLQRSWQTPAFCNTH